MDPIDLRCPNGIKYGELFPPENVLEVKCRSARCGAAPGTIVIHKFDSGDGSFIGTRVFREPAKENKEGH